MSNAFVSRSPVDDTIVWQGKVSTEEEIGAAIDAASRALVPWRSRPLDSRIEIVRSFAAILERRRAEFARQITREVGKLEWDAQGEVAAAVAKAELSVRAILERRSDQRTEEGKLVRAIRYRPLGVALVLGPFNFPLHLPLGQILPSLLAGNTIVFKPSDQAPGVAEQMLTAWREAGLPDGTLNLIMGGADVAARAVASDDLSAVFLTGSLQAGTAIHRQLSGRPDVMLAMELGGNSPVVVLPGAEPAAVGETVTYSAFLSSGQRCTCARRVILVDGEGMEASFDSIVRRTESLRVGLPGSAEHVEIGPLISASAAESLHHTYQRLIDLGCRTIVPWGRHLDRANLVRPCLLDASGLAATQLDEIGSMEWFGPLLVMQRGGSFDAAIESANRTRYGLAAALLGGRREDFDRFLDEINAGVVHWNHPTTGAAGVMPFGGVGMSGNHRPVGYFAVDACSDPVASLQLESLPDADRWSAAR